MHVRVPILLFIACALNSLTDAAAPPPSIARVWNEEILAAIRIDLPHPPVHARNLFHFSVAVYDAWAAYDQSAVGYLYHEKHLAADVAAARREAISHAAYRFLTERYALSRNAAKTLAALDERMAALGYDKGNVSLDPRTPAGVGNRVALAISAYSLEDGALQTRSYQDFPVALGGYAAVNPPLLTLASGTLAVDVNRWQPLAFTNAVSQNNIPVELIQKFLGAQWLGVRPFALRRRQSSLPWLDPGPPPHLGEGNDEKFQTNVVEVLRRSSELTVDDGVTMDISPGAFGNNTLGNNDGIGHATNPATALPYPPNLVKRGDYARVLAEFWADGPNSETPPGHWNTLANAVSDNPLFERRIGGTGPTLENLEWDVKLYFALNGALHDAACAAWSLKRYYDGWRPIEAVRFMGQRGQSSFPEQPTYDRRGLPIVPDLIEVVTTTTAKLNGRHSGLPVGAVVIRSWAGQPADPSTQTGGVRWILAANWLPFQKRTFVTPAFPGYISGHSTFSRAAAEVLTAMTGSPFFPGGLGVFTAQGGTYLSFEKGPSETVQLQWGTYFDAADQAGLSRIWGGIHPPIDDLTGRRIGSVCGREAWMLAQKYFDGSLLNAEPILTISHANHGGCEVSFATIRGLTYTLESTTDLGRPFVTVESTSFQAVETTFTRTDPALGRATFYRLVRTPSL